MCFGKVFDEIFFLRTNYQRFFDEMCNKNLLFQVSDKVNLDAFVEYGEGEKKFLCEN
jgi:hypothetical protein